MPGVNHGCQVLDSMSQIDKRLDRVLIVNGASHINNKKKRKEKLRRQRKFSLGDALAQKSYFNFVLLLWKLDWLCGRMGTLCATDVLASKLKMKRMLLLTVLVNKLPGQTWGRGAGPLPIPSVPACRPPPQPWDTWCLSPKYPLFAFLCLRVHTLKAGKTT
eukprot:1157328-Pelagomonas_calceolata.AAC.22